MAIKNFRRKVTAGLATTVVLTAAALSATASPAAASMGTGRYQLCSRGTYFSYLEFVGSYFTSFEVQPGTCFKGDIPDGTYRIDTYGVYNTSGDSFYLGKREASRTMSPGIKIFTFGTTAPSSRGLYSTRD